MHKQWLLSIFAVMVSINSSAMEPKESMGLPKESIESSEYKGLNLQQQAINCLFDNSKNHPCDNVDILIQYLDGDPELQDKVKEQFYNKYESCLINKEISDRYIAKSVIKDEKSIYILEDNSILKELKRKSGKLVCVLASYERNRYNYPMLNDFVYHKGFVITGTVSGAIELRNACDNQLVKKLENEQTVRALVPENTDIVSLSYKVTKLWDIELGKCKNQIDITFEGTGEKQYLVKNNLLYLVNGTGDSVVTLDVRSNKSIASFTSNKISTIIDSPQYPHTIFSGSQWRKIESWDIRNTCTPVCKMEFGNAVNSLVVQENKLYAALAPILVWGAGNNGIGGNGPTHPGIKVFDIQYNNFEYVNTLPGKGYPCDLQADKSGIYAAGSAGLTFLPIKSYENAYATLKKLDKVNALEYKK